MKDKIKKGDKVKVQWEYIEWIEGYVDYIPQATGDCWVIISETKEVYYVQLFSKMTKL